MRVLDKKIQKVLSMNTTQNDIQEALDSFAEYYDTSENTVDSRKNLRYSLEGISCDLTKQFATELTRFCSVCLLSLLLCCRCSINSLRLSGKSNNCAPTSEQPLTKRRSKHGRSMRSTKIQKLMSRIGEVSEWIGSDSVLRRARWRHSSMSIPCHRMNAISSQFVLFWKTATSPSSRF